MVHETIMSYSHPGSRSHVTAVHTSECCNSIRILPEDSLGCVVFRHVVEENRGLIRDTRRVVNPKFCQVLSEMQKRKEILHLILSQNASRASSVFHSSATQDISMESKLVLHYGLFWGFCLQWEKQLKLSCQISMI